MIIFQICHSSSTFMWLLSAVLLAQLSLSSWVVNYEIRYILKFSFVSWALLVRSNILKLYQTKIVQCFYCVHKVFWKQKWLILDACSLKFTAVKGFSACLLCCNWTTPIVVDKFHITKRHDCSTCILPCHSRHSRNVVADNGNSWLTSEMLLNLSFMLSAICQFSLCIENKHIILLRLERILASDSDSILRTTCSEQHTVICWCYFLWTTINA